MALPWVVVPWAPEDGAPDRVRVRVGFPGPVRLTAAFPAGLRADAVDTGLPGRGEWWGAALAVLPSVLRARTEGVPASALASASDEASVGPALGAPPAMRSPGFVFTGLFVAFGMVVVA